MGRHDDPEKKNEGNGSGTYDPDRVKDPAKTAAGMTRTSVADASVLVTRLAKSDLLTPQWRAAFGAVPRHVFLPGKSWVPDEHGKLVPIDRDQDVGR